LPEQSSNLAIAVAAVLTGKPDDVGSQPFGADAAPRRLALCRAMLPERRTGAALGYSQMFFDMLDAGTTTRGA
jgi:hypothetical protein